MSEAPLAGEPANPMTNGDATLTEGPGMVDDTGPEAELAGDPATVPLTEEDPPALTGEVDHGFKRMGNFDTADAIAGTPDLKLQGDTDTWRCLCKASSESEGWMKSTKAMSLNGRGVVIQVTTQQYGQVAEALVYVPGAKLALGHDGLWSIV